MSNKNIKELIRLTHTNERAYGIEMGKIDKQIKELVKKKNKIRKSVSKIMRYRNSLIEKLD